MTTQAQIDQFKACFNTRAKSTGIIAIPAGPLGPKTCGAAAHALGIGCPYQSEVLAACGAASIAFDPPRITTSSGSTTAVTAAITTQAVDFINRQLVADASQFPWGQVSPGTKTFQQRINATGLARVVAGTDKTYCKINEDGKLGEGTCGAARAIGIATPSTCRTFATNCRGTRVGATTPTVPQVVAPVVQAIAPVVAEVAPVVQAFVAPQQTWLEQLRSMSPYLIGLAAFLGASAGIATALATERKHATRSR